MNAHGMVGYGWDVVFETLSDTGVNPGDETKAEQERAILCNAFAEILTPLINLARGSGLPDNDIVRLLKAAADAVAEKPRNPPVKVHTN